MAESEDARLFQLAAALCVGSEAIWPATVDATRLHAALRSDVCDAVVFVNDWGAPNVRFDVVLFDGSSDDLLAVAGRLAERDGPVVNIRRFSPEILDVAMDALVRERSVSTNTAAGGNASLMTIA